MLQATTDLGEALLGQEKKTEGGKEDQDKKTGGRGCEGCGWEWGWGGSGDKEVGGSSSWKCLGGNKGFWRIEGRESGGFLDILIMGLD